MAQRKQLSLLKQLSLFVLTVADLLMVLDNWYEYKLIKLINISQIRKLVRKRLMKELV